MAKYYLGLDSSTQGLTAALIDYDARRVAGAFAVNFDRDLPQYGTRNGVLRHPDPTVVHAPPLLWVEALDVLCARMRQAGAPLGEVLAVAGSGQQHGSVYLNDTAPAVLAALDPGSPLAHSLAGIFTRATSPIWMDSSTTAECREIEAALGGAAATAAATGSAAFERFTGPQIRKFAKTDPEAYARTAHIGLVSSFMASILAGRLAPIDPGDGAGMNLMDIRTAQWLPQALEATAPRLAARLPPLAPSWQVVGPVSRYFAVRHGLNPSARAGVWSGDNPCSLIGLGLISPGLTAISLGTSDTYFGALAECRTDPRGEGHVFGSPAGGYMSLICFKNGSLARERVRDRYGLDWEGFGRAIAATPPGNRGALMLPWFDPEIVPKVLTPGVRRKNLAEDDAAANCRAVVEAQMLSMAIHSAWMGATPVRILATGGASTNPAILRIMADVHGCPVSRLEVSNSAALGAALRAAHAHLAADGAAPPWSEIVTGFSHSVPGTEVRPDPSAHACYRDLKVRYAAFESEALAASS